MANLVRISIESRNPYCATPEGLLGEMLKASWIASKVKKPGWFQDIIISYYAWRVGLRFNATYDRPAKGYGEASLGREVCKRCKTPLWERHSPETTTVTLYCTDCFRKAGPMLRKIDSLSAAAHKQAATIKKGFEDSFVMADKGGPLHGP